MHARSGMTTVEPRRRRGRARRVSLPVGRPPRGLAVLLVVALIQAVAWICLLPPLQGPDETGHVSYTQKIVESGTIPWRTIGSAPTEGTPPMSTEMEQAVYAAGIPPSWGQPEGRPAATAEDERLWAVRDRALDQSDRADGGFTSAMAYPPLYYLYEAVPYVLTYPASIFDRAFAMRLANLPLLLAVVVFSWLVAGELFGRRRWLQTLATAAVVVQPQLIHMTAVVSPDIGLAAIWAAALYVMIRLVRHGPSRGRLVWLAALVAASCLTQPRGLALVLAAVAAVALSLRGPRRRQALALVGVASLAGAVLLVHYATRGDLDGFRIRQFGSYLWQFYLPRLDFMTPSIGPDWGVRDVFVVRFFGGFAQLEVELPAALLSGIAVAALVVAALALAGLVVQRKALARHREVAIVCAVAAVGYLLLIHAAAFRGLLTVPDPAITGRYLLPLVPLYGAGIALAVSWVPRPVAVGLGVVALAGLTWLQLAAFGLLFERFYA
jgi:4-amino-4-deoxy-L-arabinose transferase-like glycosyltransferase